MIIADTNVVSELFRPAPAPHVVNWLERTPDVALTSVTVGEIWVGIERLPPGPRKAGLAALAENMFTDFGGEIEPYDGTAARLYGQIGAVRRRLGRQIGYGEAQIAAICAARNCPIATRNINDFTDIGLTIINPWAD